MDDMLVISPFGTEEQAGHIISDDLFYYETLYRSGREFTFIAGSHSFRRLREQFNNNKNIKEYDTPAIDAKNGVKVIFTAYHETLLFVFICFNLARLRVPRLVLFTTNNFGLGRLERYKIPMWCFYYVFRLFIAKIVVHSVAEKMRLGSLMPFLKAKIVIKKHHLLINRQTLSAESQTRTPRARITFFGPIKREKPVEPFFELINADVDQIFEYALYNVRLDDLSDQQIEDVRSFTVSVTEHWLSPREYTNAVESSDFLFLSHTTGFDGKLSGGLCDALTSRRPYISGDLRPARDYVEAYGGLGLICDFNNPEWPQYVLHNIAQQARNLSPAAFDRFAKDHTEDLIKRDFLLAVSDIEK